MDIPAVYLLSTLAIVITFLYFYLCRNHGYWQKRNIPCAKGTRPIIGHAPMIAFIRNLCTICTRIYRENPDKSMVGFYNYNVPCLLVREPDLAKSVLITNFQSFSDNDLVMNEDDEPMLAKNPFFTNGAAWKTGRTRLTASLTGNKLKTHATTIYHVTKKLTNYIDEKMQKSRSGDLFEVEAKDLFARVTAEIAANVGFGIEGHCFDDSKDNESFTACGRAFFGKDWVSKIKSLLVLQCPWILALLRMPFIPMEFQVIFRQLVARALENRKKGENQRNFVDIIIDQEEKDGDPKTRDRDITSHMLSFFLDIYETTSTMMGWVAYNLATHKDVQEKAREQVREMIQKHGGLNYEAIADMTYLEMIMFETLRLFPVIGAQIKVCTQPIELEGSDGLKCLLEPQMRVYIPVEGFHRDPTYWDEPDEFRPERFSKEQTVERSRTVHLPFGEGPRMCPGRKIAAIAMKMTYAALLMKYEIELSKKTKLPLEMDPFMLLPYAKGGMWINIKKLK